MFSKFKFAQSEFSLLFFERRLRINFGQFLFIAAIIHHYYPDNDIIFKAIRLRDGQIIYIGPYR